MFNNSLLFFQESYERAKVILKTHSSEHKALAQALMKYETLDKDDITSIVEGKKFNNVVTSNNKLGNFN